MRVLPASSVMVAPSFREERQVKNLENPEGVDQEESHKPAGLRLLTRAVEGESFPDHSPGNQQSKDDHADGGHKETVYGIK